MTLCVVLQATTILPIRLINALSSTHHQDTMQWMVLALLGLDNRVTTDFTFFSKLIFYYKLYRSADCTVYRLSRGREHSLLRLIAKTPLNIPNPYQ